MTVRCRRHPRRHAFSLKHSEPTRRVELPLDGLRDRYTSVVLRGQSSDVNRLLLEPAIGVEPTCPCVAHRAVTWTHRLGGAVCSTWFRESPSAVRQRSVTHLVNRVGFEPTFCLGKSQVQSAFATDPWLPVIALERASGPGSLVPPSGIEPEPLGLQPSAQTNYASGGLRAPRTWRHREKHSSRSCRAVCGADHHHRLRLSESGMRRAHLGPCGVRVFSARTSGVDASASYAGAPIAIRDL